MKTPRILNGESCLNVMINNTDPEVPKIAKGVDRTRSDRIGSSLGIPPPHNAYIEESIKTITIWRSRYFRSCSAKFAGITLWRGCLGSCINIRLYSETVGSYSKFDLNPGTKDNLWGNKKRKYPKYHVRNLRRLVKLYMNRV